MKSVNTKTEKDRARPAENTSTFLSLDEFRKLMNHVNTECRGIGCGYVRRDCRIRHLGEWIRQWAGSDKKRAALLPKIRAEFKQKLPAYFRDYSDKDLVIENEDAFREVHAAINAAFA